MALHTDIPTREQIERLISTTASPCVTIYLPTHRIPQETVKDRILLKDLTRQAVELLEARGEGRDVVEEIQANLMHLAEDDDEFWTEQADSLAIFAAPGRFTIHRLPNHLSELVEVSDRFYIKPLLRTVTFPHAAWVLALSQGSVRLLEISPTTDPVEIPLEGLPEEDDDTSSHPPKPRDAAYARRVDKALKKVLAGSSLPLILASSPPMDSLFRSVNTYPHLIDAQIHGSPDTVPDIELGDAARSVLDELYAAQIAELRERFEEARPHGRSSADVSDLARLATFGAVDTLLVDIDVVELGTVDENGAVTFSENDSDPNAYGVIDEIARRVLQTDGRVLAVRAEDMPDGASVAGLLRYVV